VPQRRNKAKPRHDNASDEHDADRCQFIDRQYLLGHDVVDFAFQFLLIVRQLLNFLFQLNPPAQPVHLTTGLIQRFRNTSRLFRDRFSEHLLLLTKLKLCLVRFIFQTTEQPILLGKLPRNISDGLEAS